MRYQKNNYLAVGNRCALLLNELEAALADLGVAFSDNAHRNRERLLAILTHREGFCRIETNPVREARGCIGASFKTRALLSEAPKVFNCSSLMTFAYGRCGIQIPRYAISQLHRGPGTIVAPGNYLPGDLIFTDGPKGYWIDDKRSRIGHVGIATGNGTVVHAIFEKGVIEEDIDTFFACRDFRGMRRVIPRGGELIIFESPPGNEADSSEAFLLKILSRL